MSDLFFFNFTATTEIYTLSLHDALPICFCAGAAALIDLESRSTRSRGAGSPTTETDRKRTRLNSSHTVNSYAVFCLKKKMITTICLVSPYALNYDRLVFGWVIAMLLLR